MRGDERRLVSSIAQQIQAPLFLKFNIQRGNALLRK